MSKKELEQHIVFEKLKNSEITQNVAAKKLGVTTRWVREKLKRYRSDGEAGLVHKSRGKPGTKHWDPKQKAFAIDLLRSSWLDFGPTFAVQKLFEKYGIKISKETLRKEMISAGLWIPKRARVKHRKKRERMTMLGIMIQCDGSPHDWFEGRGPWCTLLVFIDDATSRILWLEFATGESREAVMLATKHYIEKFGIPHIVYVDHGSSFHVNLNNAEGHKKTHWEVALESLGIEIKHAHSPQAKGRVERVNRTLQDRLVKEMRLEGISSIKEANKFLRESSFIRNHNGLFGERPEQSGDAHRPLARQDLESVFCTKEKRILANDFTIQYTKRIFQLLKAQKALLRPKDEIIVSEHLDGRITLSIRGIQLLFEELKCRSKPLPKCADRRPSKPCENSRRFSSGLPPIYRPSHNHAAQRRQFENRPAGGVGHA